MRNGLCQSVVCNDPAELAEYLQNNKLEVTAVDELDSQTLLINYVVKKEWIEENDCSNAGKYFIL